MIVTGPSVVQWVAERLGATFQAEAQGIGWGDPLRAGVVFEKFNRCNIWMHIAKDEAPLAPTFMAAIMDYPFNQCGVKRITGSVALSNEASRKFSKKLGARMEGVMEDALPDGDLCIYGLLRRDADRWLSKRYQRRLRSV